MSQLQNIYNLQIPKAANGCSNQNVCRNARLVNYITYILICLYKNILHIFMYLYMLYNVPRSQKDPKSAKSCMQAFSNALWLMLGSSPRPCITWSVSNCPGLRQGDKGVSGSRIRPSLPKHPNVPWSPRANRHLSRCQGTGSGGQPTGSGHGILGGQLGKTRCGQKFCSKRKNEESLRRR